MSGHIWRVAPISEDQRRDVRPEDLLNDGDFRLCSTYRGGGGYDQFPYVAAKRGFVDTPHQAALQFIVQLYGCNLDCPYCYVTREGVWGRFVEYPTDKLVAAYKQAWHRHEANVFHLMGGAPALQIKFWPELMDALGPELFHSDLMLSESRYDPRLIAYLNNYRVLLAVNIKGLTIEEWERNTRKPWNEALFYENFETVQQYLGADHWYLTFTNVAEDLRETFLKTYCPKDQEYFVIDLIDYEAVPYVDNHRWGPPMASSAEWREQWLGEWPYDVPDHRHVRVLVEEDTQGQWWYEIRDTKNRLVERGSAKEGHNTQSSAWGQGQARGRIITREMDKRMQKGGAVDETEKVGKTGVGTSRTY